MAEDELQRIEDAAAPIIRRIAEERALPSGDDLVTLLGFVAVQSARVPAQRDETSRFVTDLAKLKLEAATSTDERFEAHVRRLREAGIDVSDLTREDVREALHDPAYKIEVNRTWAVMRMFEDAKMLHELLTWRRWGLLQARPDAPNFICSDNPVALLPSGSHATGLLGGVGWGMPNTSALVPLTKRFALRGELEMKIPEHQLLDRRGVATVNTATLATADRHVYSPGPDFIWRKPDGRFGHARDLAVP